MENHAPTKGNSIMSKSTNRLLYIRAVASIICSVISIFIGIIAWPSSSEGPSDFIYLFCCLSIAMTASSLALGVAVYNSKLKLPNMLRSAVGTGMICAFIAAINTLVVAGIRFLT